MLPKINFKDLEYDVRRSSLKDIENAIYLVEVLPNLFIADYEAV